MAMLRICLGSPSASHLHLSDYLCSIILSVRPTDYFSLTISLRYITLRFIYRTKTLRPKGTNEHGRLHLRARK